jgi:putative SOS response-associated peptidase YedK
MCFSVNVNLVKEELEGRYGATLIDQDKYRPSYYYHAFSFPEMPVVCSEDPSQLRMFKWGLIPSHTRDMEEANSVRSKTFNARSESLSTKKAFKWSLKSKRCIVPVKGFYEWQHSGNRKIPWYIYKADNGIISLAGLYDTWILVESGEVFNTFSVITTDANKMLAEIHNSAKRMPAILEDHDEEEWLDTRTSEDKLQSLLRPSREEFLKAHTIGPLVNNRNADRDTPEIIKPFPYDIQATLF